MKISWVLGALFIGSVQAADFAVDLQAGASQTWFPKQSGPDLDLVAHYYLPIDQMVYWGMAAGYRALGDRVQVPLMAGFYARLPLGRILLPVFQAEMGYQWGVDPSFLWNTALLGDLRLGDRSSWLFGVHLQGNAFSQADLRAGLRSGLLLEF